MNDVLQPASPPTAPVSTANRLNFIYETILSTTDDFAYIFDPEGRFLFANARLLQVYARTLDEVVGRTCHDLGYPTWHADMHMREIQEVVRTKAPIRGEVPFTGDSGISGIYDYIFQPVLNAGGEVEVIVGTTRDVTERKRGEEKLKATQAELQAKAEDLEAALRAQSEGEQRFQFLADTMPQIVWTARPDGILDYYNERWFKYSGLDAQAMEKSDWTHFVHPEDLAHTGKVWQESLDTGCNYEVEFRLRRASDASYRWHLVRAFPMRSDKGEIVQWAGTCTDIDDQLRAAEQLRKAAAKFEALFDQSATLAGIMALDGTLLEANMLALEGCGYRAEQALGRPFWEGGWWSGSEKIRQQIRDGVRMAAGGKTFSRILPVQRADGSERMVDFAIYPIRDDAGTIIFLHPVGLDVTERLQVEARTDFLSRLAQKLSTLIDEEEINRVATHEIGQFLKADRCYFVHALAEEDRIRVLPDWRRDGLEAIAGDYGLSQFGTSEWIQAYRSGPFAVEDLQTHPWTRDFVQAYDAIKLRSYAFAPFVLEGHWVACVAVASTRPRLWTEVEKALLESAVARVWPLIERARVDTALRRTQEALRKANGLLSDKASHLESVVQERTARLSESIEELEAFSYSISHDMRAPLRAMRAFSSILSEEHSAHLDESGKELLDRINAASRRMDQLIQDVLNFSRLSRQEATLGALDPNTLIRELVQSYPNLDPKVVDVDVPEPLPLIRANDALLTQCVSNILDNAVKFTGPDRKPRVLITAEKNGARVKIRFKDNGIGISPQNIGRIFEMFQRVGRDAPGTGIGLAIVKKAAERMNGKAGVTSRPRPGQRILA